MNGHGFESALAAVLSGQYELCVSIDRAFIRNAAFKVGDQWSKVVSFDVTQAEADEIKRHKCVVPGKKGALHHLHTRSFPVKP